MPARTLRQDQTALLWATVATVAAWMIPVLNWIALPIEYLNTVTHEMCHAITSALTGGQVLWMNVFADGSGVTPVVGGIPVLTASAGYVGASIIGVLIILFSRNPQGARWSLRFLAVAIAASSLLWLRAKVDPGAAALNPSHTVGSAWIGVLASYGWVGLLIALAWLLPDKWVLFGATFVGLQQCLHSLMSLLTLLNLSMFSEIHSDARIMQDLTHLPAAVWAFGWSAFSLLLMAITLKGALKGGTRPS